jgi:hypothetical protein
MPSPESPAKTMVTDDTGRTFLSLKGLLATPLETPADTASVVDMMANLLSR